jgi:hypothetical protein
MESSKKMIYGGEGTFPLPDCHVPPKLVHFPTASAATKSKMKPFVLGKSSVDGAMFRVEMAENAC